ncbi:MAG: MarR family transcriptional regulator [Aquamicrobium sp.]|uniref:MarR family transcriptional regulator n=2 Tax=Neoaquamicrobium sediminum TaxID=1849104 RepID=A0ABV3WQ73_9HYPH|nr:MarR family transcriptional regulator [Aquamicrobium sp.]
MSLMNKTNLEGLGFLIHDAARVMRRRFEVRAAGYGLSAAQWRLLVRLVKAEGVPQARLATFLEIEPISVSRLLDRMEEAGWIERRPDPTDRRVRTVFATEKSRRAFAEVKSVANEIYEEALAGMSPDDRAALVGGLRTLISNLSDDDCAAEGCKTTVAKEDVA